MPGIFRIDEAVLGYAQVNRFTEERKDGPGTGWYVATGMRAVLVKPGPPRVLTIYAPDGTVHWQMVDGSPVQETPPWQGGVADQTAPSAPWIESGLDAGEFWERVKPDGAPTLKDFRASQMGR